RGESPKKWTMNNISVSKNTLKLMGLSYDWDREVTTCNPDYYRWTQWLFLKLYEHGLAYRKEAYVNWCPGCQTVLANEQVIGGKCWRCDSPVRKKALTQWFIKITEYAERLLKDIDKLEGWPERVKTLQRNWIGKSEGAEIDFEVEGMNLKLSVFTTRPDTLFGVTFITIAPEHPVVEKLIRGTKNEKKIREYIEQALLLTEIERTRMDREKTGIRTGRYAIHPFTGERIEIWIGDYVLVSYGTGIVMGVPAHDQRDFEFAKKHGIPIKVVIRPPDRDLNPEIMEEAYEEEGIMINSGIFSGLPSREGIKEITKYMEAKGIGRKKVTYRLRDWLVSRQRYWGAPIPMIHCERCGIVPVPYEDLPVLLPRKRKLTSHPGVNLLLHQSRSS
ncbi:leucine--tRNA ligase, partial [bacterium]